MPSVHYNWTNVDSADRSPMSSEILSMRNERSPSKQIFLVKRLCNRRTARARTCARQSRRELYHSHSVTRLRVSLFCPFSLPSACPSLPFNMAAGTEQLQPEWSPFLTVATRVMSRIYGHSESNLPFEPLRARVICSKSPYSTRWKGEELPECICGSRFVWHGVNVIVESNEASVRRECYRQAVVKENTDLPGMLKGSSG